MKLIQEGPKNAKLMIVGEAPGAREDVTGKPFQGGSGWILDQLLDRVGIRRSHCFITNVTHIRPPDNKFEWFYRKANQNYLFHGIIQLKDDIEAIKPNLIVALGNHALKVLTGKSGITDWRGSILESNLVPGQKVIATVHPAAVMRVYDFKAIVEFDLARAKQQMLFPEIKLPQREYILNPTDREQVISEMLNAEWLSVDIECTTAAGAWKLLCVGFSDRSDRALVLPVRDSRDFHDIRRLCESDVPKILQNGTFDSTVLAHCGIQLKNFQWDTMLAHHALYPECASGQDEISKQTGKKRTGAFAKGLAFQTSIYTDEPYYKGDGKIWDGHRPDNELWLYNGKDAAVTREIRDVQERELKDFGTMGVLKHEMSLVEPLLYATTRGILIDQSTRSAFEKELNEQLVIAQENLDRAAGYSINVKSNKQMAELLFGKLGIKPKKFSEKTGLPSADKDVLAEIIGSKADHPVLKYVGMIREIRDLLERYIASTIDKDGRMRCSFDITGTRTGRLSSRASIWGSGTNLQNQPAVIRQMFIPDPGKVFINLDYSQAEIRLVAYLANCDAMIAVFEQGRDIHRENASRIFRLEGSQISYTQRFLAKKFGHAADYGMRGKKAAAIVNQEADGTPVMLGGTRVSPGTGVRASEKEADAIIDSYFMLYPEIRETFWGNVKHALDRSMTLVTPFGRKRQFFGRKDDKLFNEAYAYVPQSTVGDLCCMALVAAYHLFNANPQWEAELLLNVHDSLLIQCSPSAVPEVIQAMQKCMSIPIPIGRHTVYIPTDAKVGYNWGDAGKDGSNPIGLKDWKV